MSAGKFVKTSYQANNGVIHPLKVQPETLTASFDGSPNVVPSKAGEGIVISKISAKTSKGNKEIGIRPRMVSIAFPDTDAGTPDGYKRGTVLRIPVLTQDLWDSLIDGDPVTYLGTSGTVASTAPENVK